MENINWKIVGPALAILVALLIGGALMAKNKRENTLRIETPMGTIEIDATKAKAIAAKMREEANAPKMVTLAEFNQIRRGMSYGDVVKIIGTNGEQTYSSNSQFGSSEHYTWNNSGGGFIGGSASISFDNGKVSSMSQMNLK